MGPSPVHIQARLSCGNARIMRPSISVPRLPLPEWELLVMYLGERPHLRSKSNSESQSPSDCSHLTNWRNRIMGVVLFIVSIFAIFGENSYLCGMNKHQLHLMNLDIEKIKRELSNIKAWLIADRIFTYLILAMLSFLIGVHFR